MVKLPKMRAEENHVYTPSGKGVPIYAGGFGLSVSGAQRAPLQRVALPTSNHESLPGGNPSYRTAFKAGRSLH